MRELLLSCAAILLLTSPQTAQEKIEISLKNDSPSEARTRERLQELLNRYDLSKWVFTRRVLIEDGVIPHSHPVLTLNTGETGEVLLSTFVHEQIHWFLVTRAERTEKAKAELRALYPKVPVGRPDGARSEESTYLHLIVIYLEYEAMKELVGGEKAREVLGATKHYRWIYKTVLTEASRIREVVEKNQLRI